MSFSETIFLFFLALIIFGPKKLPEIARTVGKYLNEFRRASNEFRAQIEQEIANLEVEKPNPPPSAANSSFAGDQHVTESLAPAGTASRTLTGQSAAPSNGTTSNEMTEPSANATLAAPLLETVAETTPQESAGEAPAEDITTNHDGGITPTPQEFHA